MRFTFSKRFFVETSLDTNERILKEGAANLQSGTETVGGKLYLTNRRLVFESHMVNLRRDPTIVRIDTISAVTKCWTKFFNVIPLIPNSLAVTTCEGKKYNFVLFDRDGWASAITSAKIS